MGRLLRYVGCGIVGWATPRLLVALGVPLKKWIAFLAAYLLEFGLAVTVDTLVFVTGLLLGVTLILVELWLEPVGRLIRRLQPPEAADQ